MATAVDNVTHVLAGLLVAELAGRVRARRAEPSADWIRAAYFSSALANNLPDFDFAYAAIIPGKLGYLLHHRGYTHTVALALILGLIPLGLVRIWARRRSIRFERDDWRWLVLLSFAGPLLHVTMDFSNSYGVHPFWPLSSRWFYGDLLSIVEPFLWAAILPQLFFSTRALAGKCLLGALIATTVVLPFFAGSWVPTRVAVVIALVTLSWTLVSSRFGRQRGAFFALAAVGAVLASFVVARQIARARIRAAAHEAFPQDELADVIASSFPGNPLCWAFAVVSTTADGSYALRRGRISLAPIWISAEACGRLPRGWTAPLQPISASHLPELLLNRELVRPIAELRALTENCEAAAYLRFARAPFWRDDSPSTLIVGDLRFDRGPELDFAELVINRRQPTCPSFVPPWTPPRADLLEAR